MVQEVPYIMAFMTVSLVQQGKCLKNTSYIHTR